MEELATLQEMILAALADGDTDTAAWLGTVADDPAALAEVLGTDRTESAPEDAFERSLLEHGFTGEITDKAGRHRRYVDGKPVAAQRDTGGDSGSKDSRTSPAGDTIAADVIDSLPAAQRSPGLVGKVKQLAHAVNERILAFAIKHEKTIAAVGHVLDAALTTPDDLAKNPALFGKFAVSGNASGDAAQSALGVPASLVSRVIATAVVKGWAAMKAKLTKRSESLESLADDIGTATEIMVGLFNAAAEGLGLPDLDPDAVRAWLEQVTAKKGD